MPKCKRRIKEKNENQCFSYSLLCKKYKKEIIYSLMKKKISFVVPMYNVAAYIKRCLDSLLNQDIDKSEYEIIIVDDGSTDNSAEIVFSYQKSFDNIHYYYQKNQGLSTTRNNGINRATGEYVWFVDSDDFIRPNILATLYNKAQEKSLDILTFNSRRVSEDVAFSEVAKNTQPTEVMNGENYIGRYNYNNGVWYYLIKREYLEINKYEFVNGRFLEDGMFTMNVFFNTKRIAHIDIEGYYYWANPFSITTRKDVSHYLKIIDDYRFAIKYFNDFIDSNYHKISDKKCIERMKVRRDSYVFFLILRLIKSTLPAEIIWKTYSELKSNMNIPLKSLVSEDYTAKQYLLPVLIFNNSLLFYILTWCSRLKYQK